MPTASSASAATSHSASGSSADSSAGATGSVATVGGRPPLEDEPLPPPDRSRIRSTISALRAREPGLPPSAVAIVVSSSRSLLSSVPRSSWVESMLTTPVSRGPMALRFFEGQKPCGSSKDQRPIGWMRTGFGSHRNPPSTTEDRDGGCVVDGISGTCPSPTIGATKWSP